MPLGQSSFLHLASPVHTVSVFLHAGRYGLPITYLGCMFSVSAWLEGATPMWCLRPRLCRGHRLASCITAPTGSLPATQMTRRVCSSAYKSAVVHWSRSLQRLGLITSRGLLWSAVSNGNHIQTSAVKGTRSCHSTMLEDTMPPRR